MTEWTIVHLWYLLNSISAFDVTYFDNEIAGDLIPEFVLQIYCWARAGSAVDQLIVNFNTPLIFWLAVLKGT